MSLVIASGKHADCRHSARTPFCSRAVYFCQLLIMCQPRPGRFTPDPDETICPWYRWREIPLLLILQYGVFQKAQPKSFHPLHSFYPWGEGIIYK